MPILKKIWLVILSVIKHRQYYFQIKPLQTFNIEAELGSAGFMKRHNHKSICLDSKEATYEKNKEYYIADEQIVVKTCI